MNSSPEWRPVVGYEGLYEVSSEGQIRRLVLFVKGRYRTVLNPPRIMRPNYGTKGGYARLTLRREGRGACRTVHSVVADAFLGPRPDGMEVGHLNGNPRDNRLANLAYVTRSENQAHKATHGTLRTGENLDWAKLTPDAVREMRAIYQPRRRGSGCTALAKRFGVSPPVVLKVVRRQAWRHV